MQRLSTIATIKITKTPRTSKLTLVAILAALATAATVACDGPEDYHEQAEDARGLPDEGIDVNGTCHPICEAGVTGDADGWADSTLAKEKCVVAGSKIATDAKNTSCLPNNGVEVDGECRLFCDLSLKDSGEDYGATNTGKTCVVPGSNRALNNSTCKIDDPYAHEEGECPLLVECPEGLTCGCQMATGLGAKKKKILDAGGIEFLASAMMENEKLNTNYPYGDIFPDGTPKTGDSWNGGVAKQNWYMMRECHPAWQDLGPDDYMVADDNDDTTTDTPEINSSLELDAEIFGECMDMYGDEWFAFHRAGAGAKNPTEKQKKDIERFTTATLWVQEQLEQDHQTDDTRFFVDIENI